MLRSRSIKDDCVTVLLSLRPPDGTTRFVDQIVSNRPAEETVKYFSWRTALVGSYDVFHVHWPEWLIRHDRTVIQGLKHLLMVALLFRIWITSTPVIRTVHNVEPHSRGSRAEDILVAALGKLTTEYILLNPLTPCAGPSTVVRHGHYIDRFDVHPRSEVVRGRILFFGRIEPYKKVADLIDQFAKINSNEYSLRIVGSLNKSAFPDEGAELIRLASSTPHVSANFEFVSDEDLVKEITAAQLVVLHYTEMHNSGALLVALSLGRVVYSAPSSVNQWMQDEVGSDWLMLGGELTPDVLVEASAHSQRVGVGQGTMPDLRNRDWSAVASNHYKVYLKAARSRRARSWKK